MILKTQNLSTQYGYCCIWTHTPIEELTKKKEILLKFGIREENIFYEILDYNAYMKDRKILNYVKEKILKSGDTLYSTNMFFFRTFNDFWLLFLELDKHNIKLRALDFFEKILKPYSSSVTEKQLQEVLHYIALMQTGYGKAKYNCHKKQKKIEQILQTRNEQNSIVPELAKLLKKYKRKYPDLKSSHLRLILGQEFYLKRGKVIKAISEGTYYRALRFLREVNFL